MASLPSLELKYVKSTDQNMTNTNTNTNTINNNILINTDKNVKSDQVLTKSASSPASPRIATPNNVKIFKETFMNILIGYFKNNIILLNNLVELSEKIIMKVDDLQLLISILLEIDRSKVMIEVEELEVKCCAKFGACASRGKASFCSMLPRYRKINDILINNQMSFKVSYNQFYVQLQTVYNISLDYILL
jgi:hypothetical protein